MPHVSLVIPAYRARPTLPNVLQRLRRQTFKDFELIVIESGDRALGRAAVEAELPQVTYRHLGERRPPHVATNAGLEHARGRVLAFLDADAYPALDWLEEMLEGLSSCGPVVYGGVACYGRKWLDLGAHLCKFDKWLPKNEVVELEEGVTMNMAIERTLFAEIGPFRSDTEHADTDLAWRLRRAGYSLWHVPDALVEHHHQHSLATLLQERYERGRSFVAFGRSWRTRTRGQRLLSALVSVLPLRLVRQLTRVGRNAVRADLGWEYVRSFPVILLGLYAWLLGGVRGELASLRAEGPERQSRRGSEPNG